MRDTIFDFLTGVDLPTPDLSPADAGAVLRERFGIAGTLHPLGSQQDQNFLVRSPALSAVMKVSNPAFSALEIDLQDLAADRIAARGDLRVATLLRAPDGSPQRSVVGAASDALDVRLIRFLDGGTLTGSAYLPPQVVARMGEIAGTVSVALAGLRHPAEQRSLQWNPLIAEPVIDRLLSYVRDDELRERVESATTAAGSALAAAGDLPQQLCHLDLTDDNLVRDPRSGLPDGIIDFGDVSRSWAVGELASTLSCILHHAGAEPASVLPAVRAFHRIRPLSVAEATALWPLVVLRGAVLVVSGEHQLAIDPGNAYAAEGSVRERLIFERSVEVPTEVMTATILHALGLSQAPVPLDARLRLIADGSAAVAVDLTVESDAADGGAWLTPGLADRTAARALQAGADPAATAFGAARVDLSRPLAAESLPTVATGVDVWFAAPTELVAPASGTLVAGADAAELCFDGVVLRIRGLADAVGGAVRAGERLGTATRIHVQLQPAGAPVAPSLVRHEYADGWLAQCIDPSSLFGLAPRASGREDAAALLDRRARALAEVQEHYFFEPPRIERGWRNHLLDDRGRVYLDMVNNVTSVGHAHPRLTAAVARQLDRLNTNSRFHYAAIADFSERLAALLPDPLDTVFLVNSGSEAVDLALRIAMAATGRRDVVAVREAYHGWTFASDAVSTSVADNPNALESRPDWVHTVEAPNPFRGRLRGADAAGYAPAAAAEIARLAAEGAAPAAFLSETVFGNAGGIPLPKGYLAEVYAAMRGIGGLAIADEVQVGYGRLGEWFWGFEQQGVVPDVVAVAKSMGNGYPLGAVITSRAVADRYRSEGYFFSSTGGSPVSSVVGTTVLDIIRDEGLQENARIVGERLRAGLEGLADRHPLVGALHGFGLYLGLELVRDRATHEPAPIETAALCERLRELGVIMQPTGDHLNVLKIKPPLCIDADSADYFVAMVDRALADVRG